LCVYYSWHWRVIDSNKFDLFKATRIHLFNANIYCMPNKCCTLFCVRCIAVNKIDPKSLHTYIAYIPGNSKLVIELGTKCYIHFFSFKIQVEHS
jgi:hypothetical protein